MSKCPDNTAVDLKRAGWLYSLVHGQTNFVQVKKSLSLRKLFVAHACTFRWLWIGHFQH